MKSLLWILGAPVGAAIVLLVGTVGYLTLAYPKVSPAPDLIVEPTPERLERGRYLVEHVMGCMGCHSERHLEIYSYPPIEAKKGGGGLRFGPENRFPGTIYSKNITPYNLQDWTDGEIFRAIAAGVTRDGQPIFPLMPYLGYGTLDREDIYSVVAYLRTLKPVKKDVPETKLDLPLNFVVRTMPADPSFTERPDRTDTVAYSKYMATAAGCADCHTKMEKGEPVGEPFAGGNEFYYPGAGLFRSANITPDEVTGIGEWSREDFVERFKSLRLEDIREMKVERGEPNTVMPWWEYAGMTREDLVAIYDYLMTLEPVRNEVVRFEPLPAE